MRDQGDIAVRQQRCGAATACGAARSVARVRATGCRQTTAVRMRFGGNRATRAWCCPRCCPRLRGLSADDMRSVRIAGNKKPASLRVFRILPALRLMNLVVPEQPASKLALALNRSVAYLGAAVIRRKPLSPLPYFRSPFLNRDGAGVVPSAARWSSHNTGGLISSALSRTPSGRASSRIAATMSGASRVKLRCLAT